MSTFVKWMTLAGATGSAVFVLVVFVGILAIALGFPFFIIWSLNTLFGLAIGYTFKTWLAAFILELVFMAK